MGKKNDNFSHFAKHRFIKNRFVEPFFDPKLVLFNFDFLKPKTLMLNKKHNLKSGKAKIRKRDPKEKARQETKKERNYLRKKSSNSIF